MAGVVGTVTAIPGTGVVDLNLQSHCTRGFRYVSQRALGGRDIGRIDQHGNASGLGHQLVCEATGRGLSRS